VPAGDIYRLTIRGRQGNDLRMNQVAVRQLGADDPTEVEITGLANDFKDMFRNQQFSTALWLEWEYRQLWGPAMTTVTEECRREGGLVMNGALTGFLAGDVTTGEALPHQCAMVVTLISGFAGRRKRGRWYGWGYPESAQADSLWGSAFTSGMNSSLAAFLAEYGNEGTSTLFGAGIWSERTASGCEYDPATGERENVDPPAPLLAFTPLTNLILRPRVQTQRRRVPGVGF